jgi:AraC-like DNA-binding protein
VRGSGKCVVEGDEFPIEDRTIIFVCPFEYHTLVLDKNTPYERYVIQFSKAALSDEHLKLLRFVFCGGVNGKYYSSNDIPQCLINAFDRIEESKMFIDFRQQIYLKTLLSELVVLLTIDAGCDYTATDNDLGARVIKYLNENIDKDISLDRLARRFFVSKYYLCRAFKKHNGISIHGYISQKRVMRAKQMIESGETASGAAYRVGFGDYSAFYRAYVKIIGKSPTSKDRTIDWKEEK